MVARQLPEADVCIVGLGAVGALVALGLADSGRKVLALEAGPLRPNSGLIMDELMGSMVRNEWGAAKFNGELPTWRLNADSPSRPMNLHARMGNGVGGTSWAYAGTSLRFHPDDFRVRTNTIARYGESALPEGSDIQDWPISYDDLEPFYDEVERLIGVSGRAGNVGGEIRPGGNPFEGPRQRDYPVPPLRLAGQGALFAEAAEKLGYHTFPVPTAILSEPYDGRQACTYCSFCSRSKCHVDAKGSTAVTVLPRAIGTGNLEVRANSRVTRILVDGSGDVVGVEYVGPNGPCLQPAGVVVLASYAFENVRLLLMSKSKHFPEGIGNNYGQVGRYYITHQNRAVAALFEGHKLHRFIGPYSQGLTIDDWNADNFDHTGAGFIRGGRISMINQCTPILDSRVLPPGVPRWGAQYKKFLATDYNSIGYLSLDPEVLPYGMNFLDLDPEVRDPYGNPVIRITFDLYENEHRLMQFLQEKSTELMKTMGATRVWQRKVEPSAISTHDAGGTRMGDDPRTSVVDGFGRVHGAPRLFVAGGSTYPTHSGLNSTLTMQALGLRTGRYIAAPVKTQRGRNGESRSEDGITE